MQLLVLQHYKDRTARRVFMRDYWSIDGLMGVLASEVVGEWGCLLGEDSGLWFLILELKVVWLVILML